MYRVTPIRRGGLRKYTSTSNVTMSEVPQPYAAETGIFHFVPDESNVSILYAMLANGTSVSARQGITAEDLQTAKTRLGVTSR